LLKTSSDSLTTSTLNSYISSTINSTNINNDTSTKMKLAAVALLLASIAIASPAPIAEPIAEPIAIAQPEAVVAQPEFEALAARVAEPNVDASKAGIQLDARKSKPKSSNGNNTDSAAITLTPSRALELGALSLGVLEIVRLWG
jgi:hypothetical protein